MQMGSVSRRPFGASASEDKGGGQNSQATEDSVERPEPTCTLNDSTVPCEVKAKPYGLLYWVKKSLRAVLRASI